MIEELNIMILKDMLKSDYYTPLHKYFIWEKLNTLRKEVNMGLKE